MAPGAQGVLAGGQPKGAPVDPGLRGGRGSGAPLAARAMTVAGLRRGLAELEPNRATQATAADRCFGRAHLTRASTRGAGGAPAASRVPRVDRSASAH